MPAIESSSTPSTVSISFMDGSFGITQSADRSPASPSAKIESDSRAIVNGPRVSPKARPLFRMRHSALTTVRRFQGKFPRQSPRQSQRSPVPPQRWHLTTLSPFFSRPLPSQFLHFCVLERLLRRNIG